MKKEDQERPTQRSGEVSKDFLKNKKQIPEYSRVDQGPDQEVTI